MITKEGILKYLMSQMQVLVYDELASTNNTCRELSDGTDSDMLVAARRQSGGRGRMGRSFFSPDGGLYMSLLLHPEMPADKAVDLTTAAAVAVSRAIESLAPVKCEIKWVNDVYIGGKKVCGILTEAKMNSFGGLDYAVVGIGVNLVSPDGGFPEDIRNRAGAVFDTLPNDMDNRLAAGIVDEFMKLYHGGFESSVHLEEYCARSFIIGREVDVMRIADGETRPAVAVAIDDEFRLVVRYSDGSAEALGSGDVSLRGI